MIQKQEIGRAYAFRRLSGIFRHVAMAKLLEICSNLMLITVGSILCAATVNGILIPFGFQSGGFVGVVLIVHHFFSGLNVAGLYFLLNIPVFLLGWRYVGKRFFLYSCAGMVIFSAAVRWIYFPIPMQEKMLAAILAGIISGAGSGLILRSLGSAGGMDILSIILLKRYSVRLGSSVLTLNIVILGFCAYFFSVDSALYTLGFLYVSTKVLNIVVYGFSQRKAVYIVSSKWQRIQEEILNTIQRGVTILEARGGFTGQEIKMLFSVVTFQELPRIKKILYAIDPQAFLVVNDTLEVMGNRIGNQPHW
ncbi:MAG: YitT family protein [Deltaproteobacteria bacterium]|nr:YitT family protein [Deltaproteobacteria bacterium]